MFLRSDHHPVDGKPATIAVMAIAAIVAGFFACKNLNTTWQATTCRNWQSVPCTITKVGYQPEVRKEFRKPSQSSDPDRFYTVYIPEIEYIYRDHERAYTGTTFHVTEFAFSNEYEAKRFTEDYAPHTKLDAWMNPHHPKQSCLIRPSPGNVIGTYFPLLGLLVTGSLLTCNVLMYKTA